MEVGRLTPGWFSILVGDTIDDTEVRGWRKTGRPQQSYQSFTELKVVRCIVYGSNPDNIYRIRKMPKSSYVSKSGGLTMETGSTSKISDASKKFQGVSNESQSGSTKKDTQDDDETNPHHPTKKDTQDDETK
ncbi:hypothetical protein L6452_26793 [Arctium lappa]|uniref:Uncharacterized protein n=1 Tax=Arctium lappa TaxID=4217 RepID=A0ACB8ZUB2_ARCLA|nr:hypothetical protein L6452_26793 [Arctium lappa]